MVLVAQLVLEQTAAVDIQAGEREAHRGLLQPSAPFAAASLAGPGLRPRLGRLVGLPEHHSIAAPPNLQISPHGLRGGLEPSPFSDRTIIFAKLKLTSSISG